MKKFFLSIILIVTVSALISFIRSESPHYENLKVLPKDISKQGMDSIMKHFALSLGVRCTFCHVRETDGQKNFDFASDKNEHKIIARDMYKMTGKINNKYFKEGNTEIKNKIPEVSCFTCHHGRERPENVSPSPAPKD